MTTTSKQGRPVVSGVRDGAAVRLSGLHKSFGRVQAVRGVDLTIAPGEVVAFLGPNGAGKSTTIDMLLGLTRPDRGSVAVFGSDPVTAVQAGRVGAMLQSGALLPDVTVKELVATFAALHRHPLSVTEAMRRAEITEIAGQKTTKLSGGQSQRVRYALALVPDPDLLVLDEPTVAMDVEIRRAFWASMREFTGSGRTVLFATHYLEEADDFADRVVVLAGGRIVADGTGAQIKATVTGPHHLHRGRRRSGRARRAARGDVDRTSGTTAPVALQRFRRDHPGPAGSVRGRPRHRDQCRQPRGRLPRADRCRSDRERSPGMSMTMTYTLISARSTFRNTRFVIFTLALPLVMYLLFNGLYGNQQDASSGISVSAYLMVSMAAYGGTGRGDQRRRPGRDRAPDRVEPAAAAVRAVEPRPT